jgi:hypothetical protein
MANSPKECRSKALTCLQLALDSALPVDKQKFASLATRWVTLANDLEAIEAQLKSCEMHEPRWHDGKLVRGSGGARRSVTQP